MERRTSPRIVMQLGRGDGPPVEALRKYLQEMPALNNMLLERLGEVIEEGHLDYNNAEEMRLAYKEAQQVALERIVDLKLPYYQITYLQVLWKCILCDVETQGAYYEISNPLTMKRGMIRVRMMHEFLAHGHLHYEEPIVNMSETLMGQDHHPLDVKKLSKILEGLPLPPEVQQEIDDALAAQKVAS